MFSFKVAENQKHRLVGCYNIPLSFTTLPPCLFSCLPLVFLKAIFKDLLFCLATWKCGFQRRQHWEEIQLWQGGLDAWLCSVGLQIYGNFTPTMSIWKPQLGSPTQGFLLFCFFFLLQWTWAILTNISWVSFSPWSWTEPCFYYERAKVF